MKETAVLFGADPSTVDETMRDVIDFEIKLAKISTAKEKRRNHTMLYNPVMLKDFPILEGSPPSWVEYVDRILFEQHCITEEEIVIIKDPDYFKVFLVGMLYLTVMFDFLII